MANGLVFVKFLYPGHFGLVIPSHYFLKTDEIYGLVRLTRNVQAVDVLDFTNKLILDPGGGDFRTLLNPIDSPGPKSVEITMATQTTASDLPKTLAELKGRKAIDFPHRLTLDPVSLDQYRLFGTRDWTDATISYEVENIESVTTDDAAFFQKIWNRFISVYRLKTNDSRILYFEDVGEPLRWSIGKIIYLPDEYSLSPNDRLGRSRTIIEFRDSAVNFPYAHEGFFEFDIRRATQDVFEFLKSDRSISLPEELLLKAHEAAYYRKNFRYALVEAFTAAEMCVSKYLNDLKVRRGESARSIDKFQDMPMARKLREVTLHFSNIDEHEKRIMGEIDWLRRERNVVVHEGKVLGHIEARRAVDAVQALFEIISARSIQ